MVVMDDYDLLLKVRRRWAPTSLAEQPCAAGWGFQSWSTEAGEWLAALTADVGVRGAGSYIGNALLSPHSRDDNKIVAMATMDTISLKYKQIGRLKVAPTLPPCTPTTQCGLQMDSTAATFRSRTEVDYAHKSMKMEGLGVVARDGIAQHYTALTIPLTGVYLDPKIDLREAR